VLIASAPPPPTGVVASPTLALRCSASRIDYNKNGIDQKGYDNPNFRFDAYLKGGEGPATFDPPYLWSGVPSSSYSDSSRGTTFLPERLLYKYGNKQPLKDGLSNVVGTLSINRITLAWKLDEIQSISPSGFVLWVRASGICRKEFLPLGQF